ncbi:hypothetical protein ACFQYP_37600 [Nonomuraea antimicrobica]
MGVLGMFVHGGGPRWIGQIYDPYAYLALSLAVGATASGFGWALLTTFLAAASTLVAAMGASALGGHPIDVVGVSPVGLNWNLSLLVALGLLAYATRRDDGWGDLAAGAVGAALLADVVERATPGFIETEVSFWPGPAVVVGLLSVALVLVLRRSVRRRVRALVLSAMFSGLITAGVAAFMTGWVPPSV